MTDTDTEYRILDRESLPSYLNGIPAALDVLSGGQPIEAGDIDIIEIGDGNLNFVYLSLIHI